MFGDTDAASFTVDLQTQITAIVGEGSTGKVSVTTEEGTGESEENFTFIEAPTITSFTPTSGGTGTIVTITGTNLSGVTAMNFGGTGPSDFTVDNDTQITATVGSGSTGKVSVTAPGGTATSNDNFTFIDAPTITSFTPTSGGNGTTVVITGTHFAGTEVKFGGTPAASFTVDSETQITAIVGEGLNRKGVCHH
ncbi:MAG: IPT/TIG domain-containing protein [Deltaproteobacteria bacterium]|nr:IPT/TIG domain-containing protein [Deltaproteobacteria bacterium]